MKNTHLTSLGFTLVEVLVSITILSIIMVSVLSVYTTTINISARGEANRILQENIKNIIETIGEDVRKNKIIGAGDTTSILPIQLGGKSKGIVFQTSQQEYYLAQDTLGSTIIASNSECKDIKKTCYIQTKKGRITNSSIAVENLEFRVTNDGVPKVTLLVTIRPAIGKGVKSHLIKKSKLTVQTTFSQRALAQ